MIERSLDQSGTVMHVLHVVGARPNFMKATPVMLTLDARSGIRQTLVHTGQHYDYSMSAAFFAQLGLRAPDFNLNVGSGSHAEQTANVMLRFEKVVLDLRPDLVLVYGDVNSTLAATLVSAKLRVPVGHVEAGLRSGDRSMPEETNRLATDCLADILFTPSADADANLLREGVSPRRIHCVGNVMIDTLVRLLPQAETSSILAELGLMEDQQRSKSYVLVTLHRPSNVDTPVHLRRLLGALHEIGGDLPVIFPVNPRTMARIEAMGLTIHPDKVHVTEPLAYLEFLCLQKHAAAVVTDSAASRKRRPTWAFRA